MDNRYSRKERRNETDLTYKRIHTFLTEVATMIMLENIPPRDEAEAQQLEARKGILKTELQALGGLEVINQWISEDSDRNFQINLGSISWLKE